MLKRLREEGFIEMAESEVRILDKEALTTLADFDDCYLARHPAAEGDLAGRKNSSVEFDLLS
jgi:hypothetical protein